MAAPLYDNNPLYENDAVTEPTRLSNIQGLSNVATYDRYGKPRGINNSSVIGPPALPPRESGYTSRREPNEYSNDDVLDGPDLY